MRIWLVGLSLTAALGAEPPPLTLGQACHLALQSPPRLKVVEARSERSRAAERESWAAWNPKLNLEASYTYTTPNAVFQQGGQSLVFSQHNNHLVTLRLTQLLWNGGFYANQAQARAWQVKIAQEREREMRLQLEEEAAQAFLQLKSARETLALLQQQVEQRQAQLKQSEQLFERGSVPRFDILRGQAELARARQELLEGQRQEQNRRTTLASLIQQPVDELAELPEPRPAEQEKIDLGGRPDLRLAELALKESGARLEVSRTENSPSLSFQTDVQNRNTTTAFPGTQWNTGLVFSWPLFDQGLSAERAEQVEAELKELAAQAQEVERTAHLEVEQLQGELRSRWGAWEAAGLQTRSAEEARRVAQLRYENGLSTYVERLESELNWTRARRDQIVARYDLAATEARWRRARGLNQSGKPVEDP